MSPTAHIDLSDGRHRSGAALLLGCRPFAVTTFAMQHGNALPFGELPAAWAKHAVVVLERVHAEHGALPMVRVLEMLADGKVDVSDIDRPRRHRKRGPR